MTQQIIENHFLNVGNSRYNDESFRKQNPGFSAISRFGIGILSTFMISDEIEVITKAAEDKQARNLSIRSLNGKYLIRMLDSGDPSLPEILKTHGTRIQLRLRAGVEIPALKRIAEFWILFPECEVTVKIDDTPGVRIGYESPKEALEDTLKKAGYVLCVAEPEEYTQAYRVDQVQRDGLRVAYALQWQPAYKNWAFANLNRLLLNQPGQQPAHPTAVCVHGVRVESTSPGFAGQDLLAISDISGPKSPATNVARSNLETGVLVDEMFSKIYGIYAEHISSEIQKMSTFRGVSVSAAASEGRYLSGSLQGPLAINQCPTARMLLNEKLKTIPFLTIDKADKRSLVSLAGLDMNDGFWSVEGSAYKSAEDFMRRMQSDASIRKLATFLQSDDMTPDGSLLGGYAENTLVRELVIGDFEVDRIELLQAKRQANLHWRALSNARIWKSIIPTTAEENQRVSQVIQQFGRNIGVMTSRYRSLAIQDSDGLCIEGSDGECGLKGSARSYIFCGNQIHTVISDSFAALESNKIDAANFAFVIIIINSLLSQEVDSVEDNRLRVAENMRQMISQNLGVEISFSTELKDVILHPPILLFDPMRGERYYPYGPYSPTGPAID